MTTTHVVNLVLALGIVVSLAAVCRLAFVVAGHRPAVTEQRKEDAERLAA